MTTIYLSGNHRIYFKGAPKTKKMLLSVMIGLYHNRKQHFSVALKHALFPRTFCFFSEHKHRHFFQPHFTLPAPLLLTLGKLEWHMWEWWVLRTRYQPRYYCYNQHDTETGIYQSSAKHQLNTSLSLSLFVHLCPRATTHWKCLVEHGKSHREWFYLRK